ncbi:hypothetical protein BH20ACT3_BH20ACT3_10940 [soil metagenome]
MADDPVTSLPPERLAMVYDADGGLVGETRYVIGHLLGRVECALCDITHGPVRHKAAFGELLATLPAPVDVVHRNEQDPDLADATRGRLPCVAARRSGTWSVVLGPDQLAAYDGEVVRLGNGLRAAGIIG